MILSTIKFDLLKITHGQIAHGVNCQGVMGAGVAKKLSDKFPDLLEKYQEFIHDNGAEGEEVQPGCIQRIQLLKPEGDFGKQRIAAQRVTVYNLFTQEFYGDRGGAKVEWVKACVDNMDLEYSMWNDTSPVFIPRIGCGLGGLDWGDVRPIFNNSKIPFIVCLEE